MKLRTRLSLLIAIMLATGIGGVMVLSKIHTTEQDDVIAAAKMEKETLLDQLIPLLEYPLDQLARDYSQWDEMVDFLTTPNAEWGRINIDVSLTTFNLTATWVINSQGEIVYTGRKTSSTEPIPACPISDPIFQAHLKQKRFIECYLRDGETIYALRAAPIQPSADIKRTTTPKGWLICILRIDPVFLGRLGSLNNTTAQLLTENSPSLTLPVPALKDSITVFHQLKDVSGQAIARLRFDFKPWTLTSDSNVEEMGLLVVLSILFMASVFLFLHISVLQPFEIITQSLVSNDPEVLKPLINNPTEIGHIARLVRIHFAQLRALNDTMEDKAQLARDLHDGVIQSIFAAGMGVATAQAHLKTDPSAADNQLNQIRTILNGTIQETRSFITGLESKEEDAQPFAVAVETLVESMSWIRKVNATIDVEKPAAAALSPTVRGQAMQMIREAISNSLRHGHADNLQISLKQLNGKIELLVADDGIGFDLEQRKNSGGRGLANLVERAHIFGAVATIESSPGKGTCVHITFSPSTTPPV